MHAITNTKLVMEDGIIFDGTLLYENGIITAAGNREDIEIPEGAEVYDAHGLYTAPGLIDIHNHGAGMWNFDEDPLYCAQHFLEHGETTVLPTFYANISLEGMLEGGKKVRELCKSGAGRIMDGLYMEGPYMSGSGSFASSMKWHEDITPKDYVPLVEGLKDLVRIWAIDPARKNIEEFMAYAKEANPKVLFAVGHSNASYEQCLKVAKYGLKCRTHIGDGGRHSGNVKGLAGAGGDEYALYQPDVYAEMICDRGAVHVVPGLIKLFTRTKGVEKICLISDSMCDKSGGAFKNDPERVPYQPDLNYDDTGWLAGSHLTLDNAVHNMMVHSGYGLCHSIRMASLNPATLLGIDDKVGSIAVGKKANLIVIDDTVAIKKVILEGDLMVDKE